MIKSKLDNTRKFPRTNKIRLCLSIACRGSGSRLNPINYRQIDGLSMGGKPAPPLANIWLAKFEPAIRDTAKLFERYMDDIIREIKRQEIQAKLNAINQLHPMLKFTIENETDGKIPFLDMEIHHVGNSLSSTWYVKETDTGLIMNYHALAPKRYKKSVVQSFVHRIFRCCSSWELMTSSLERAKAVLDKNQYPAEFYEPIIGETLNKIQRSMTQQITTEASNTTSQPTETTGTKHMMKVQYRGAITDRFVKSLYDANAPVFAVITLRKIRTFVSPLKTEVPDEITSRIVYQITCPGCQACYVGQTDRHQRTRFGEHKTQRSGPVRKHFEACVKRKAEPKDMKILHKTTKSIAFLETLEALYIRELKPTLNTRDEWRSRELTILV